MKSKLNKKGSGYNYSLESKEERYFKKCLYESGLSIKDFCENYNIQSYTNFINVLCGKQTLGKSYLEKMNTYLIGEGKEPLTTGDERMKFSEYEGRDLEELTYTLVNEHKKIKVKIKNEDDDGFYEQELMYYTTGGEDDDDEKVTFFVTDKNNKLVILFKKNYNKLWKW